MFPGVLNRQTRFYLFTVSAYVYSNPTTPFYQAETKSEFKPKGPPSYSTTSLSFSTASAKRATSLSKGGMSSTSMAVPSVLSKHFPWFLLKPQAPAVWNGNPAALAWRLSPVERFRLAVGDAMSLLWMMEGVPGHEDRTAKSGTASEDAPSIVSLWGCSWRTESWIYTLGREEKNGQRDRERENKWDEME